MSRSLERIANVAGSTALSRVLGLVREMLAARLLGASALHSAFLTAFTLPNLFRRFLGEGALTGALVPVLTDRLRKEGHPGVFEAVNQVFSWLSVTGAALVVAIWLVSGGLWFLGDLDPRFRQALLFTFALMPFLLFVCGAAALAACCQVLGRFGVPALGQVWLNLCMILALNVVGYLAADTMEGRVWWLCGGVLVGGVFQLITPAAVLWRMGWRPGWSLLRTPTVREVALLMGPSLLGAAIYQINLASSRLFAFHLDESAASYLNYASRLMELPMGMFAIAVATVVFPLLASHASAGNTGGFCHAFRQGVRLNLAVTVPAGAGLILLAEPIIRVLFQAGEFTAADTEACVPVLAVFAAALPFHALSSLCVRAFHAVKDTQAPLQAAIASLVANLALSLILPRYFGTPGLAAAANLAMGLQAALLARAVARRFPEVAWGRLWEDLLKIAAATVMLVVTVLIVQGRLGGEAGDGKIAGLLELAASIPAGGFAYGLTLWILRLEGREQLWKLVQRRLSPARRGPPPPPATPA